MERRHAIEGEGENHLAEGRNHKAAEGGIEEENADQK